MNNLTRILSLLCLFAMTGGLKAEVITIPDVIGLVSGFDATTAATIFSQSTHPDYFPIDDNFEGTLIFTFTIRPRTPSSEFGRQYIYFLLRNEGGAEGIPLRIGNAWDNLNWSFQNPEFAYLPLLDGVGNTVNMATNVGQEFVLTIEYRAGAEDSASVLFAGHVNILPDRDYSFTNADAQGGYGTGGDPVADFINMSVEVITGTGPGNAPTAPTGLAAVGGDGEVTLDWNSVAGADSYNVKRAVSGGTLEVIGNPATPGYLDTSVTNGVTYEYRVSAVSNEHGEGEDSAPVSVTPTESSGEEIWAGYSVGEDGWADTGEWMGRLYVVHSPWVFSELNDGWIFLEASYVSADGTWIFIPNYQR